MMLRIRRIPAHRPRPGWMLIELLAAMTIVLAAAGTSTLLIVRMLKMGQTQSASLVQDRTVHQWASQFRQDCHDSQSSRVQNDNDSQSELHLSSDQQTIVYRISDSGLERLVNHKLTGRWAVRGTWNFSLHESGKIVRAELFVPADHRMSEAHPPHSRPLPSQLQTRLDVTIGRTR